MLAHGDRKGDERLSSTQIEVELCNTYTNEGEVKKKKLTYSRFVYVLKASQAHKNHKSLQAFQSL